MKGEERRALESQLNVQPQDSTIPLFKSLGVGCACGIVLGLPLAMSSGNSAFFPMIVTFLMGAGITWIIETRKNTKVLSPLERDIQENEIEVLQCSAVEAIELEQLEEEGLAFFLDLENRDILFVEGDYLYELAWGEDPGDHVDLDEVEKEGRFPNRHFQLIRAPHSGHVFQIVCLGQRLPPSRRIDPETLETHLPKNGQIFKGSLNTLEKDLIAISHD
jgi:hypothetical protein